MGGKTVWIVGGIAGALLVLYFLFRSSTSAAAKVNLPVYQPSSAQIDTGIALSGISALSGLVDAFRGSDTGSNDPGLESYSYSGSPSASNTAAEIQSFTSFGYL
jgi:hypothetical protein